MNRSASARILLVARGKTLDPTAVALGRAGDVAAFADSAARATESVIIGHSDVLVIDPSALGARAVKTLTALAEDIRWRCSVSTLLQAPLVCGRRRFLGNVAAWSRSPSFSAVPCG